MRPAIIMSATPSMHRTILPSWLFLAALLGSPTPLEAGVSTVFDLDGRTILQDEDHVGINNGKLTAGINYRDVAGMGGLWAPPFVSSNFSLDVRVDGEKVPTSQWTWRPFQVERNGAVGPVRVATTTTMLYGHRATMVRFTFKNNSASAVPLDLFALGWLDAVQEWTFPRPASRSETAARIEGRHLTLRQGNLAVVLGVDSPEWTSSASGNLGHSHATLPARQSRTVHVIVTIGTAEEASAAVENLMADPGGSLHAAAQTYNGRVRELFDRLPTLESTHAPLVRWYQRSLVHLLMNRWEFPEFVLQPYYSTGSIKGGCVGDYLWNFGEVWEILPLLDPAAARNHIQQFLRCDLLKHFLFEPIQGKADGPWYMINQEKILGLTYYYVLLTGDTGFLAERLNGQSVRDHMVLQAMFGDEIGKPMALIDYGPSNSHLELRRQYAYHHVMPDLNARRYANYLRAAELCDLSGQPAGFLRERAALLRPLIKERLWDAQARWFRFEDAQGNAALRHTVQMFKTLGSGVLDRECEDGLISHLNEDEFLSPYGLHSLSKLDPAFDQLDIDNGGGGICTSFPPQIIERLYQAGQPGRAADLLKRLLWWGDTMPYWGDSIAANRKDYRRDTPLQCTLDGAAGAQCVIFGVFGIRAKADGNIVIQPHRLPFAERMSLKNVKIRGQTFDVRIQGSRFEVRTDGRTIRSTLGSAVSLPAKR